VVSTQRTLGAASQCKEYSAEHLCVEGESLQIFTAQVGAIIGGIGAGVMWTFQGAIFSSVCERIASAEVRPTPDVTSELAGIFAFFFLAMECTLRAAATLMTKYAKLDYSAVFCVFSGLALLCMLVYMVFGSELHTKPKAKGSLVGKAMEAVKQWNDPITWLLQFTNFTFGFAAAWLAGYVGRNILSRALDSDAIGFAGALLSGIASLLSRALVPLTGRIGKGPVLALGACSFALSGILSASVGNPATWGWGAIVFYVLVGIGRAVYESTNKAIFADFFPGDKSPGAFANVFVFSTGASCVAFILGSMQRDMSELYLLVSFAVLTVPSYLLSGEIKNRRVRKLVGDAASPPCSQLLCG